jgi:hypothetical protein
MTLFKFLVVLVGLIFVLTINANLLIDLQDAFSLAVALATKG